jgi:hypothetical protein
MKQQIAQEAADERTDDAEHDRAANGQILLAGNGQPGQCARNSPMMTRLMIKPSMGLSFCKSRAA